MSIAVPALAESSGKVDKSAMPVSGARFARQIEPNFSAPRRPYRGKVLPCLFQPAPAEQSRLPAPPLKHEASTRSTTRCADDPFVGKSPASRSWLHPLLNLTPFVISLNTSLAPPPARCSIIP